MAFTCADLPLGPSGLDGECVDVVSAVSEKGMEVGSPVLKKVHEVWAGGVRISSTQRRSTCFSSQARRRSRYRYGNLAFRLDWVISSSSTLIRVASENVMNRQEGGEGGALQWYWTLVSVRMAVCEIWASEENSSVDGRSDAGTWYRVLVREGLEGDRERLN